MEHSGVPPIRRRLGIGLGIALALLLVEAAGGLVSHSLALLADAGHIATDVVALSLSYFAARFAERQASRKHTFGLYRAEILAAFINAQILLVACGAILWEAWRRFQQPKPVAAVPMFLFGLAALCGNVFSARLLHAHRHENLNVAGAYLEVLFDALGALAVMAAAVAISVAGILWIDPLLSAAIAILIVPRTVSLLRKSAHILMEGAPAEIDQESLRRAVSRLPGVESVHDLHVWTLTSGVHSASLHVTAASGADADGLLHLVQEALKNAAGIDHATIQIESPRPPDCGSAAHR